MTLPNYRVWNKENKSMHQVGAICLTTHRVVLDSECVYVQSMSECGLPTEQLRYKWYPLSEFILMQSTGLIDKNGVEVFEGDVVEYSIYRAIVRFGFQYVSSRFKIFYPEYLPADGEKEYKVWKDLGSSSIIIGNIHQNPELLK